MFSPLRMTSLMSWWQPVALQEILLNPEDVKSRNLTGSVEAATMDGKLYATP